MIPNWQADGRRYPISLGERVGVRGKMMFDDPLAALCRNLVATVRAWLSSATDLGSQRSNSRRGGPCRCGRLVAVGITAGPVTVRLPRDVAQRAQRNS